MSKDPDVVIRTGNRRSTKLIWEKPKKRVDNSVYGGYRTISMKIQMLTAAAVALALCASATAEPSKDELTAMLQNPTSDWSSTFTHLDHHGPSAEDFQFFKDERQTLRKLADMDAKNYAEQRPATDESAHLKMGERHALKHNLIGYVVSEYAMEFSKVLEGLSERNMKSAIIGVVSPR